MTSPKRSDSLPDARATALFARTVHRELGRAGYDRHDLVRFTTDLLSLVMESGVPSLESDRLVTVLDPETGLPSPGVSEELVDFEVRRVARLEPVGKLLVFAVHVGIPEWCADDDASRLHVRTALALRQRLRPDDGVLRLSHDLYLGVVRDVGIAAEAPLLERLARALSPTANEPPLPKGTRFGVRFLAWDPSLETGRALIDACLRQPSGPLAPPARAREVDVPVSSLPPPVPASNRVVLALGGGAVPALAHAGVVRVLLDAGIDIAGIAATSAGAVVGAMLLAGNTPEAVVARFEALQSTTIYTQMRRAFAQYLRAARRRRKNPYFQTTGWVFLADDALAAISDDLFTAMIEFLVGPDRDIATLDRPFVAAAADLVTGRLALLSRGPLHAALKASCALPGLFAPQRDGSRLLVDGAILAEVPVAAAPVLRLDAPLVAVHLERTTPRLSSYETSSDVITRAHSLAHTELVRQQLKRAPVLVNVAVGDVAWIDFRKARSCVAHGEAATRALLDDILRDIRPKP